MKYKLFGRSGLRVSELCLGTMTFGTEWNWGSDYENSKKVFDAFVDNGGNFFDTANRYTEGTSEKWLGEFIHQERDRMVLATKFTLFDRKDDPNFMGNHRKNMMRSVNESLKRLNTDYIDLFWVHAWDFTVRPDELMRSLDDLVSSGKVLHIGISDTPAWIISQCNTISEMRGWNSFVGLQIEYSLLQRTVERDLLPMAKSFDLAVTPWGAIGGGALTGKYLKGESGRVPENSLRRNERANNIANIVAGISEEMQVPASALAVQWTRQKNQTIIPIVGTRKVEQLLETLECTKFEIPDEFLSRLNEATSIEMGFPHDFLENSAKGAIWGDMFDKMKFS
jgi:aryl-alcohol dehydrogenase-like predicted oxidoreductase